MADGVLRAERGVTGHGRYGSDPRGGPATRAWGRGRRGPKYRGVTAVVPVVNSARTYEQPLQKSRNI